MGAATSVAVGLLALSLVGGDLTDPALQPLPPDSDHTLLRPLPGYRGQQQEKCVGRIPADGKLQPIPLKNPLRSLRILLI